MTGDVAALLLERAALLIPQWRQVKHAQGKQTNPPDNWPVITKGEPRVIMAHDSVSVTSAAAFGDD